MKRNLVLAALLLTAISAFSLDRTHFLELNKKGRELRQKQDWKGLRDVLLEIGKELPSPTPTFLLRMASVETRLGNHVQALRPGIRFNRQNALCEQRPASFGLPRDSSCRE